MSTAASVSAESKEGLKLLVTAGPRAQKMVGIWLFGSAAWVFSMVVLGGVTRLTRSGLSMTDWKFTGSLPPLSEEEWLAEFEKYKQSPEYKRSVPTPLNVFDMFNFASYANSLYVLVLQKSLTSSALISLFRHTARSNLFLAYCKFVTLWMVSGEKIILCQMYFLAVDCLSK